jgi:hypothetical protein
MKRFNTFEDIQKKVSETDSDIEYLDAGQRDDKVDMAEYFRKGDLLIKRGKSEYSLPADSRGRLRKMFV